ncbi:50S ribosomal protein L1 [Candidatus Saccharibacteria bacterium]|nr:50S ribosomal protein L1 [Candidatus Saccharibacteria bacterium]
MERRGKNYREKAKSIDSTKEYSLGEAIAITLKTNPVKFDATVELHVRLNVDPRQADQNIRGNVTLPAGTGKTLTIAVFAEGDDVEKAKKAGADIVGVEDVENRINKGTLDFDVLISTPMLMAKLGKHARVLGPRRLMPNPKSGTVTTNVAKAVTESKSGKVEYRVDSTGIIHLGVGKVSFKEADIKQNVDTIIASIKASKPTGIKGNYFKSMYLTSSMGPSIKVILSDLN